MRLKNSEKSIKERIKYLEEKQEKEFNPYREENIKSLKDTIKKQEVKNG